MYVALHRRVGFIVTAPVFIGVLLLLGVLLALAQSITDICPPCFNNQEPFSDARGYVNGRRVINVAIRAGSGGNSWATSPGVSEPRIASAAREAMDEWNNREDTGATNETEKHIPYYFDTTNQSSAVDIVIEKMPLFDPSTNTQNDPAEMLTGTKPYKLRIREDMLTSLSAEDLAAMIKHELGHAI